MSYKHPPPVDDKKQTAKARGERKQKASDEWWLTFWTGASVIVALLLLGVGAWQVILFRQQLKLMHAALGDGATVAKAAFDTARITHEEFIAAHRPKIVVRRVIFGAPDTTGIQFVVTNTGNSPAKIVAISAKPWLRERNRKYSTMC